MAVCDDGTTGDHRQSHLTAVPGLHQGSDLNKVHQASA